MPFNLFTRPNRSSHTPATQKCLFKGLEPERVATSVFMIRLAEGRQSIDDLLVGRAVLEVNEED